MGYGPGWYGWWGPGYYYGPPAGKVKIVTPDKNASVYVDGGYVGPEGTPCATAAYSDLHT